jgi:hypothetical protein
MVRNPSKTCWSLKIEEQAMTNEEIQKTMEFILQQQAQFTVNIQRLEETLGVNIQRLEETLGVNIQRLEETLGVNIQRLEETQERTARQVSEIAAAQAQMYQSQTHMNNVVAEMADAQARTDERLSETDERLNNLINIVERYISERRNGNRES